MRFLSEDNQPLQWIEKRAGLQSHKPLGEGGKFGTATALWYS